MLKEVRSWSLRRCGLSGLVLALLLTLAAVFSTASAADAAATAPKVTTNHWKSGAGEGYQLTFSVADSSTILISDASVTGPGLSSPVSLQRADENADTLDNTVNIGYRPSPGDTYTFTVSYADSTAGLSVTETVPVAVSAVLDSFATPGAPVGPITSAANPTFTWTAPLNLPSGSHSYRVYMEGKDGSYQSTAITGDYALTNYSYKYSYSVFSPNTAPTGGILYDWSVSVVDSNGNSSEIWSSPFMLWTNFTGRITDLAGNGVPGVSVYVYDSNKNVQLITSSTDADGNYYYGGLASGSYMVAFSKLGSNRVYYRNKLLTSQADLVTVATSSITTGINSIVDSWGLISGKAVNTSNVGVAGVTVALYDMDGNAVSSIPTATTKTDGTFMISPVPPGTYTIKFIAGSTGYLDAWYANQSPLTVTAGQTSDLSSDTILYKALLTGKVTDASGSGVSGAMVWLYTDRTGSWAKNVDGSIFAGVQTQSDGSYAIAAIPSGTYYLFFEGPGGQPKQYYRAKGTLAQSDAVTVSSSSTTANINVILSSGVPNVTAFSVPASSPTLSLSGVVFTATEPNGVMYLLSESSTPPSASAAGWSANPPTGYTFTTGGSKTLYGWVKGFAGNVAAAGSQTIDVSNIPLKTGDCDNDGTVTISEVQTAINMYLGLKTIAQCVDVDSTGDVSISEVQKTINAYLGL